MRERSFSEANSLATILWDGRRGDASEVRCVAVNGPLCPLCTAAGTAGVEAARSFAMPDRFAEATPRACLRAANAGSPVCVRITCLLLHAGDRLACEARCRCRGAASPGSGVQARLLQRGRVCGPGLATGFFRADAIAAVASSAASVASLAVFFALVMDVSSDAAWHSSNGDTPRMRIRLGLWSSAASPGPEPPPPEPDILNGAVAGPRRSGQGLFDRSRRRPRCAPESSACCSNAEAAWPLPTLLVLAASSLALEAAATRIATAAAAWSSLEAPPQAPRAPAAGSSVVRPSLETSLACSLETSWTCSSSVAFTSEVLLALSSSDGPAALASIASTALSIPIARWSWRGDTSSEPPRFPVSPPMAVDRRAATSVFTRVSG